MLQRDRELEAVRRISETLFQHTDLDNLVETSLRTAIEEVGAEAGSVLLADFDAKQLIFHYSIGEKPVPRGTAIPWDQGIAGAVFQFGKPAILGDVKKSARHYTSVDQTTGFVTRDMITLPLKRWEGEPIGVLNVLNKRNGTLGERDLALLTILSAFTALAIQQSRLFEEAKKAEVVDLLGDIGHDLKNLLQPVVSGTWLLKAELDEHFGGLPDPFSGTGKTTQDRCNEVIQMVKTTTERIHERVKEIADCVKGLSTPPQFAPCKVAGVMESVLQTLNVLATDKGVALRIEGLEALPPIMADEHRLYNALYNLVNNAIPEVPRGGSITVSGRADITAGVICLSVADTGNGMPPE
ncbi:MAG: GAF domain-containing protein, partial [Burkholderiales bacterium]